MPNVEALVSLSSVLHVNPIEILERVNLTMRVSKAQAENTAAESLTFVAPIGYSLELLMLWSDKSLAVTFGIASTLGMILGSLAYAIVFKRFRIEGFVNAEDTRNHIVGALLMGIGGVTAMGCTIGQGVTGVSTLALGSFLAVASMLLGCWATLKYEYWKMMREA